jgi:NADPH:quinone reductase-like Zn-dependent oxidoreductase
MGSPREYRALLEHVRGAAWHPVIDSVHPFQEIDRAAQRLMSPARFGKVVLTIA